MPRRVIDYTVEDEGRDKGKRFKLTEMAASAGEEWAAQFFTSLAKNYTDVPEGLFSEGMAGVAAIGLQGLRSMDWRTAKPLLDQMMACVQIYAPSGGVRALIEDDIEEIMTRLKLRVEVFRLHVNFSTPASPSTSPT
jgi:hypothetical protein